MSRNNRLTLIPPEIVYHLDLKLYNFFFFGLRGWVLKKSLKKVAILQNWSKFLIETSLPLVTIFSNIIFGVIRGYLKYVQLKGRSFKYLLRHSNLVLKFGFSHKVYYLLLNNICITLLTKQILKVTSKTFQKVSCIFFDLHSIRKFDKYKGKGLIYYKDSILLKTSSKKTKA